MRTQTPDLNAPFHDNLRALAAWRKATPGKDGRIALIAGAFRLIHPGNLHCIAEAARKLGGLCAVIEPENDNSETGHSPRDRAQLLALVRGIDAVAMLTQDEITSGFQGLKPYILADCLEQPTVTPAHEMARNMANTICDIEQLRGCFTRDISAAIRSGHTLLNIQCPGAKEPGQEAIGVFIKSLNGKKIVTVNGCFDILHPGHARLLTEARQKGDALIVLVNDNESVRQYKGPARPVFPIQCRLAALNAMKPVTAAFSFAGDNPLPMLALIRPTVHVKGGSFIEKRMQSEKQLVESWGGRIDFVPMVTGFSTTDLLATLKTN